MKSLLRVLIFVTASADIGAVQNQPPERRTLESYIDEIVGGEAVPCGYFGISDTKFFEKLKEAYDCSIEATEKKAAFRLIVVLDGFTPDILVGVIGKTSGDAFSFSYYAAPCGDPTKCAEKFSIVEYLIPGKRKAA